MRCKAGDLFARESHPVKRPVVVAALLAAVALWPALASAGTLTPIVGGGLRAKAQARGSVRVLVQLRTAGNSDGQAVPFTDGDSAVAPARRSIERDLAGRRWSLEREFPSVPIVAMEVSRDALEALALSQGVAAIVEDRLEKPMLAESAPMVQADLAWEAGADGTGWTIAVLDTGIDAAHPFLLGKVVDEVCFSGNGSCPNGSRTQTGPGAAAPCGWASSSCVHGTHVAGIAAGRGAEFSGVARGASIMAIQVFSRFTGKDTCGDGEDPCARSYNSDTLAALDYVYQKRQTFKIAAANMSLGGGLYSTQAECDADDPSREEIVQLLRQAGIPVVAAAGNEGKSNQLSAPGCLSGVVSVGAVTKQDAIASFSDAAPFLSLLAPGYQIYSSIPRDRYAVISGTSQATPHVAGAFAVLYDHMGRASVDEALAALRSTGLPLLDSRNGLTFPRIRIKDAMDSLGESDSPGSGLQITPDGKHTLISKDIGVERWALSTTGDVATVTGNVFSSSGGDPAFLWCKRTGSDGNPDPYAEQIDFACEVAANCDSPTCPNGQWHPAGAVTLPGSFFLPRTSSGATAGASSASVEGLAATATDPPSALQVTPGSAATLVSKTVGGQRWSIARNADDGTVTGNVYAPGGGDPQFVFCTFVSSDGNPDPAAVLLTYSCSVAQRCTGETCAVSDWSFYSSVTLPGSFFRPR